MKKILFYSLILTVMIIFVPAFIVNTSNNNYEEIQLKNEKEINYNAKGKDEITTFSSSTCFKKTYYISSDKAYMYEDNSGKDNIIRTLKKDDVIVAYKDSNGYLYCEEGVNGKKGWIKKDNKNIFGSIYRNTEYIIDINLSSQEIKVLKNNNNIIRQFKCSSGILGDQDTETPIGVFSVQTKGEYFFSNKYNQGARYYIKFFANYLIHSIPIDEKGNIIEEEKNKIGIPASHGCVRVSMEDSRWLCKNIPDGSTINIHY